jgi:hypothetical protein
LRREIVDLAPQVGHSVGQILQELHMILENCCMVGSIGVGCGVVLELLPRPWRITGG